MLFTIDEQLNYMIKVRYLLFIITIIILATTICTFVIFENAFLLNMWNIPACPPSFLDARQIGIAAESYAQGYDPLKENLYNSKGKYQGLNYPRIWHILLATGINQSHTNLLGSIFTILFFVGVGMFWFSRKFDNPTYFILSIIILSPPVMLGIERGNIELVIFFILAAALIIYYYSTISGFLLFTFASILKLYPVFAFVVLLKEQKKKFLVLFILACVICTGYVLATFSDLKQIYLIQPPNPKSSYGLNVFWMGLTHPRILNLQLSANVIMTFRVLSYIALTLIFIGAFIFSLKTYNSNMLKHGEHLDAFRLGAGIYIGCFLLGTNYDYRLIFLIFTIPQLVAWLLNKEKGTSLVPPITLLSIVFSLWSFFITRYLGQKLTFLMEEFANWIILAGLLYLFLASVPDWCNSLLRRPLSRIMSFDRQTVANR